MRKEWWEEILEESQNQIEVNPVKQAKITHEVKAEILSPEKEVERLNDPQDESNIKEETPEKSSQPELKEE